MGGEASFWDHAHATCFLCGSSWFFFFFCKSSINDGLTTTNYQPATLTINHHHQPPPSSSTTHTHTQPALQLKPPHTRLFVNPKRPNGPVPSLYQTRRVSVRLVLQVQPWT
jgi:hypothetical protein